MIWSHSLPAILEAWRDILLPDLFAFLTASFIFTCLSLLPRLECNRQAPWWRNRSIKGDFCYLCLNPLIRQIFRFVPVGLLLAVLLAFARPETVYAYLINGWGPLGRLNVLLQGVFALTIYDFLAYWIHRLFHTRMLWPAHAIHHAPSDVDWSTAYRFHPVNLILGPWLVTTVLIFLGVSPQLIVYLTPFDLAMAFFVHANLNIALGPLKYLIATPVFHRWHHTAEFSGRGVNYGANFSVWDVIFRTFYFPPDRAPANYGVYGDAIGDNYFSQILYPFRKWFNF